MPVKYKMKVLTMQSDPFQSVKSEVNILYFILYRSFFVGHISNVYLAHGDLT